MNAIILDIDGTLLDSMDVDNRLYFEAVREVIGPVHERDVGDYEHVTDGGILAQVLEDNGHAGNDDAAASIKSLFLEYLANYVDESGPFPIIDGAIEFVARLTELDDTHLAIATGCWRESAVLKLESAGFEFVAYRLATGDDAIARVDIMRAALDGAADGVESITYFGDGEWDRRACAELGWDFVAVGPDLGGLETYVNYRLHD